MDAHGRSWKTKRIGAGFLQTPMWFFVYRFVIVRLIVWDTWLDQKKLQNNDSGKLFFWQFLMLSWTKPGAAAENEKQTPKGIEAQRKERNLEHPDCSCRKARPCSFLSPAWRVVTSKSWGKRLKCGRTVLEMYSACSANSSINRPSPHSNAHHQVPPVQNRIWPLPT